MSAICSEIVKVLCLRPIPIESPTGAEDLHLRIEIHQEALAPKRYFAVVWRVETYATEPRFAVTVSGEKADHLQLVVDDFLTERVAAIRASTMDQLVKKVLAQIHSDLGLK